MAITQDFPTFKVEITVDGIPLEEFNDEDEHVTPNSVTKYIESRSGAEFVIKCTLTSPFPEYDFLAEFFLDGKHVSGTYMLRNSRYGNAYVKQRDGVLHSKDGNWFLRKFCFSELTIDDSGAGVVSDQLMKTLKGMGEIKVEVHRIENMRTVAAMSEESEVSKLDDVPEKALKGRALSHQSRYELSGTAGDWPTSLSSNSLKPPVAANGTTYGDCDFVDGEDYPCAMFTFKYRSKRALQSLLIIPRSPSPVPLEQRDVDTLTPEESRELIRRLRERDQAARVVKREGVKRERSPAGNSAGRDGDDVAFVSAARRRRLPVTIDEAGVETIDLT